MAPTVPAVRSQVSALQGLKVLDLIVTGPVQMCSTMLADLGADVLCIERHVELRRGSPANPSPWDPESLARLMYESLNRSKGSITFDLRVPQAREAVYWLVALTDVLLELRSPR